MFRADMSVATESSTERYLGAVVVERVDAAFFVGDPLLVAQCIPARIPRFPNAPTAMPSLRPLRAVLARRGRRVLGDVVAARQIHRVTRAAGSPVNGRADKKRERLIVAPRSPRDRRSFERARRAACVLRLAQDVNRDACELQG